jgi:hypothetical protein
VFFNLTNIETKSNQNLVGMALYFENCINITLSSLNISNYTSLSGPAIYIYSSEKDNQQGGKKVI